MTVYEIVGGVILLVVAAAIIFFTLCQHTKGQGLSGAVYGGAGDMGKGSGRVTPADQMLAKLTRAAGIVLFVVAIIACALSSRMG